jgi:Ferritin-like domain
MWTRKAFLAAGGAALVAAGCGGEDDEERAREARAAADLEIVRFLLFVERLSTSFWEQVVQRSALPDGAGAQLAADQARNERTHVELLERYERRLARSQDAPPSTNFGEVFAAGPREILRSGGLIANLAAAGYLGQTNRIQDRNLLASVLAIHTVEGRQAAAVNRAAGEENAVMPGGAFAEPMSMSQVRNRLRRFT